MSKLQLGSTSELMKNTDCRIFLYGENRSGKTRFTSTWPRPLYIVPELGMSEMKTVADSDFPLVSFSSMDDCYQQVLEVAKLVRAGKHIGGYIPRTIIFDNLSTAQVMFERELKTDDETDEVKDTLTWEDWGKQKSLITSIFSLLHSCPAHVIWISHPKLETISRKVGGKTITEHRGSFTLSGAAKSFIPGNCDMIYSEVVDRGLKGPAYYLYGVKQGVWPAGLRQTSTAAKLFEKIGPDPHYDDLAPYLNLPSLQEEEADKFYK